MARILVAGAGGYIGIPLCRRLLLSGHHVIAFDKYYFGRGRMSCLGQPPSLRILDGDVRHIRPSELADIDVVIDLAGFSNDASSEMSVELTNSVNLLGGLHLARTSKYTGVRRYIYASSAAVYGDAQREGLSETDECRPTSLYAHIKLRMETHLSRMQSRTFETVILRNSTAFGFAPRMRLDLAVNAMTSSAWNHNLIRLTGGGHQWRPLVHVSDIVQAINLAVEADARAVSGEIFNVGGNHMNMRMSELSQIVGKAFPSAHIQPIVDVSDRRSYNLSFDKISSLLGFECKKCVQDGVIEIKDALSTGLIRHDDPTCHTLQWYKAVLDNPKHLDARAVQSSSSEWLPNSSGRPFRDATVAA